MRLLDNMSEKVKEGIRSWLRIQPANKTVININEVLDFEGNAIKNRIWYRGESEELKQLYNQLDGDRTRFWSAVSTTGLEIRKIHVGLPAIIVDTLAGIVVADMNDIELTEREKEWNNIVKENNLKDLVKEGITESLYIGDGAFKISFDSELSEYPILEYYSGDKIDIKYKRGRIYEIVFKTIYNFNNQEYVLLETYGYKYINYTLTKNGKEVNIKTIPELANLEPVTWEDNFIMAVPLMFYKSSKYEGRGKSIFDGKIDSFDSLDEVWSQWMDALRKNRTKEYIPENMLPRNPFNGEILKPNAFDNAYIKTDAPMGENQNNKIELIQGNIPHESYLSSYITALDLCLQGIISPSTLGIDVKKLDNAEAQREKEKTTLYTRNNIVEVLQVVLTELVNATFKAYDTYNKATVKDMDVDVTFGEYANPSFESQVETIGKAKTQGIMSIDAVVDELYGDTKDETWKSEEVTRLKAEQGIMEAIEPSVAADSNIQNPQTLNGAQVTSLMSVIGMVKNNQLKRNEAINIITSTLGISKENAETFIENNMTEV